jgi:ParB-like chromosome segregation protein Spo0J
VLSDRIENLSPSALQPYSRNARTHSKRQIRQIADSIRRFGFTNPVLIDKANIILAGHGRVAAATHLGVDAVPADALRQ